MMFVDWNSHKLILYCTVLYCIVLYCSRMEATAMNTFLEQTFNQGIACSCKCVLSKKVVHHHLTDGRYLVCRLVSYKAGDYRTSERPKEYYSVTINRLLRNRECAKVTFAMRTMFGLNWVDPHYTVVTVDKEQHMVTFFIPGSTTPPWQSLSPRPCSRCSRTFPSDPGSTSLQVWKPNNTGGLRGQVSEVPLVEMRRWP